MIVGYYVGGTFQATAGFQDSNFDLGPPMGSEEVEIVFVGHDCVTDVVSIREQDGPTDGPIAYD